MIFFVALVLLRQRGLGMTWSIELELHFACHELFGLFRARGFQHAITVFD